MIKVTTPAGKRALAAALERHDPAFLADLKIMAERFGPFSAVAYLSDDPAVQAAVEAEVEKAKAEFYAKR